MQGDIFQLEQLTATQAAATHAHAHIEPSTVPEDTKIDAQVAIYNEDDLSHLLYANHLHHNGHKDRVIINHVYRDGYATPFESGTQTPESETNETPVLSDCESDFDEGVYLPSSLDPYYRTRPLRFEDGFEFPVFLGRQSEETSHAVASVSELDRQAEQVRIAALEESHVSEISGPLMSWWPASEELMEHEWIESEVVERKTSKKASKHQQVSSIEGPLMSWWPLSVDLLRHEWDERFYE
ncbi:uncharacterized protein F4812DRAFT_448708 [Daldinia caldariorum]|uniref:uncharacterized protein n=1 Tax=Daldinia caldariorum TaxID=326644 RepID=UPI0020077A35|nr:uncharacterized protein F4812DRAFT_448708 [Daldinia caldariorum]KAI1462913.1 hypothetical protein F4812DRAFT_448708 [Daldinia caldariorum]